MRLTPIALAALLGLTVAAYLAGLDGPLVFDDHSNLHGLIYAAAGHDPGSLVDTRLMNFSGPTGRPVAMLTFIANALWTPGDLWAWKLTNLLLHLVNGVLLFALTRALGRLLAGEHVGGDRLAPLLVTGAWLLMPLHVSTVLYTVQRMTELATLFTLSGLLCYLSGRARIVRGGPSGWLGVAATVLLFWPLATLSKETGALLPLYILLVEWVRSARPDATTGERRWSRRAGLTIVVVIVLACLLTFEVLQARLVGGYAIRDYRPVERLLTEARVMVTYLRLTLVPSLSAMGFHHDAVSISTGLLEPPSTLAALLLLVALAVLAVRLRGRVPLFTIGVGTFFIGHLLESTVVPLDLMYEHRQYAPSAGVALALVAGLQSLPLDRRVYAAAMAGFTLLGALLTWQRATAWADEGTMLALMVNAQPDSPSLTITVANRLAEAGHGDEARRLLGRLDTPGAELNLAYLDCVEHGQLDPGRLATIDFAAVPVVTYYETSGLINLGRAGLARLCEIDAKTYVALVDRALAQRIRGEVAAVRLMRAHFLHRAGRTGQALVELEWQHRLRPNDPIPDVIAAEMLIEAGRLDEAGTRLERARKLIEHGGIVAWPMIDRAAERLEIARASPDRLTPYDPMAFEPRPAESRRSD